MEPSEDSGQEEPEESPCKKGKGKLLGKTTKKKASPPIQESDDSDKVDDEAHTRKELLLPMVVADQSLGVDRLRKRVLL